MNRLILFVIAMTFLSSSFFVSESFADKYTHVGIQLSEACDSLVSVNDTETCYSYPYINQLYPEVTIKPSFQTLIDTAQRTEKTHYQMNSILLNHQYECVTRDYCNIFDIDKNEKILYWFNPDTKFKPNLDILINIHTNLKHKNIDKNLDANSVTSTYDSRTLTLEVNQVFVYPSCRIADYNPEYMLREFGGLLWYMFDNCRDSNKLGVLEPNYTEELSKHELDITTSPNWQYEQKLKEDIARCKTKC